MTKSGRAIQYIRAHSHAFWILLFTLFYMVAFGAMERGGHLHYHLIHTWLDDQIPFCEYFIIPYFLWFAFNVGVVTWFVICADVREYYKLAAALTLGMTLFLVVSYLYPNQLDLRPDTVPVNNICGQLVAFLYRTDTSTNVLPSIHVYNTMVLCYAVNGNERLRRNKKLIIGTNLFGASIVLSTMFLKQHSVIDVGLGLIVSVLIQMVVDRLYETQEERAAVEERETEHVRSHRRVTDN